MSLFFVGIPAIIFTALIVLLLLVIRRQREKFGFPLPSPAEAVWFFFLSGAFAPFLVGFGFVSFVFADHLLRTGQTIEFGPFKDVLVVFLVGILSAPIAGLVPGVASACVVLLVRLWCRSVGPFILSLIVAVASFSWAALLVWRLNGAQITAILPPLLAVVVALGFYRYRMRLEIDTIFGNATLADHKQAVS